MTAEPMTPEQKEMIRKGVTQKLIPAIPKAEYAQLNRETAEKYIIEIQRAGKSLPQKGGKSLPDGNAPLTQSQSDYLSNAIRDGNLDMRQEDLPKLTKQKAHEIISAIYAKQPPEPASDRQKDLISELVKNGHLYPLGYEKFSSLTKQDASHILSIGLYNQEQGKTIPDFDPQKANAPNDVALMSKDQEERLKQLVHDGYLNPIPGAQWKNLTVKDAGKYIYIGKQRESLGEKAPPSPNDRNR